MRRIDIEHITKYLYPEPVEFLPHKLLVRPREGHDIRIESSSLQITPAFTIEWQRGTFGNSLAIANFSEPAESLEIVSRLVVQHYEEQPSPFELAEHAWPEIYLPGTGWRGFDSTSGQTVGDDHIAVAVHRHPEVIRQSRQFPRAQQNQS